MENNHADKTQHISSIFAMAPPVSGFNPAHDSAKHTASRKRATREALELASFERKVRDIAIREKVERAAL